MRTAQADRKAARKVRTRGTDFHRHENKRVKIPRLPIMSAAAKNASWPPPPPKKPTVSFLHFPKAGGMTFATSVEVFGGIELTEGDQHRRHAPLRDGDDLSNVAALFRHPEERLLSTYWYVHEHGRFCCEPVEFGYTRRQHLMILKHASRNAPPHMAMSGFSGCQANMILGQHCFESPASVFPNRTWHSIAAEAKARIDKFKFVGLVSEFFLSLCLFNYKLTGARYVTPFQTKRCNPTHLNLTRVGMSYDEAFNHSSLPYDHLDHAVFQHAQKRFWADVAASGVSQETCAANLTRKNYGCQSWPRFVKTMRYDHARIAAYQRNVSSACVADVCYSRDGHQTPSPAPPALFHA